MMSNAKPIDRANLKQWLETEFRDAVRDDEQVQEAAAALAVSMTNGDGGIHALRIAITAFVRELVDPVAVARQTFEISSDESRRNELQALEQQTRERFGTNLRTESEVRRAFEIVSVLLDGADWESGPADALDRVTLVVMQNVLGWCLRDERGAEIERQMRTFASMAEALGIIQPTGERRR